MLLENRLFCFSKFKHAEEDAVHVLVTCHNNCWMSSLFMKCNQVEKQTFL